PVFARLLAPLIRAVPPGPEALVWWLALVMSAGITAVLPILPLYAEAQGADVHFIGWMVGAYMATNLLALYPAGWLSDRVGRRTLMGIGLVAFGLASAGFLVFKDPWAFVVLRGIEGVAGACFVPAALAYVADRAPEAVRGTRIAQLTVAQNVGLLLGPVFGGALAMTFGLGSPFLVLAALCVLGGLLVARLPEVAPVRHRDAPPLALKGQVRWLLLGALAARALTAGIGMGLYETAWPLYMKTLGATAWDVSMSWTLFALPAVLLAVPAGRIIDRHGPVGPVVVGAFFSAAVTVGYAYVGGIEALLWLCVIEGIGFAFAYPALSTLNIQAGSQAVRGRIIGIVTALGTLGALVGALVMPGVYASDPKACFYLTAGCLFAGALVMIVLLALAGRQERRQGLVAPVAAGEA
ncbi:MAG: MFS transporter, partial [Candidatus Sericytochromatia bacterium]